MEIIMSYKEDKNYEESVNVDPLSDINYFKLAEIFLSLRKYGYTQKQNCSMSQK